MVTGTCFADYIKQSFCQVVYAFYCFINTTLFILSCTIISGWFASIVWDSSHPSEPRGSPSPFPAASVWHCQRYVPEASMDDKCCCGNTTNRSDNRYACKANIRTSLWCPGTPAVAANNQCIWCNKNQLNHACDHLSPDEPQVMMQGAFWHCTFVHRKFCIANETERKGVTHCARQD